MLWWRVCCVLVLFIPITTGALEYFGGPIQPTVCPLGSVVPGLTGVCKCANDALYIPVGPPKAGKYIFSPSTRTYRSGSPRRISQWVLGEASVNYYCVISVFPFVVVPGKHIDFLGSSI